MESWLFPELEIEKILFVQFLIADWPPDIPLIQNRGTIIKIFNISYLPDILKVAMLKLSSLYLSYFFSVFRDARVSQ